MNGLGGAAVLVGTVAVPLLLSRHLSNADFSTWAVCFPVVGYAATLAAIASNLMIQGIAAAAALRDGLAAQRLATTLGACVAAAGLLVCLLAWVLGPAVARWTNASAAGLYQVSTVWQALGLAAGFAATLAVVNHCSVGCSGLNGKISTNSRFTVALRLASS